jgi:hypothetical protein
MLTYTGRQGKSSPAAGPEGKWLHQRWTFDQQLLDALLATLHNSLRILCCCGAAGLAHIENSTQDTSKKAHAAQNELIPSAMPGGARVPAAWPAGVAGGGGGGVSRAGGGGVVTIGGAAYQYPASVAPNMPHAHTHARVVRCNLTTLTEVLECAGFVLRFLLQVC